MFTVTKHDQKYDRQMRLWGGHGQKKLEEAHICCLGSGPTASECLKNLVLPNVGKFTIVDDAVTSEADLGNNFFVDSSSVGKPRAEVVSEFLVEMNPAVQGTPVVANAVDKIAKEIEFFKDFSVVVACNLPEKSLILLSKYCNTNEIPLVVLASYGLLGYARLQVTEQCIIESHYDNDRYDLFIHPEQLEHFPELQAFIDKFPVDLKEITDQMKHSHIPFVVILSRAISAWMKKEGDIPSSWDKKKEFKQSVKDMANNYDVEEENFNEAVHNAKRVYIKPSLDSQTQAVLEDSKTTDMKPEYGNFWVIVCAIKRFINNEGKGCLPCSNAIPDMTTMPEHYVELGTIYKNRADRDEGLIHEHAKAILIELGHEEDKISKEEISYVVKNLRGLRVVRTGSIADEYDPKKFLVDNAREIFEDWAPEPPEDAPPNPRNINWYFAYRACQLFHTKHSRWPGTENKDDNDFKELVEIQQKLYKDIGLEQKVEEICLEEMVRFGASEIHNIAAHIGGIGSQIVLKTLIQQYVPLDNTMIFNGTHGSGANFKF